MALFRLENFEVYMYCMEIQIFLTMVFRTQLLFLNQKQLLLRDAKLSTHCSWKQDAYTTVHKVAFDDIKLILPDVSVSVGLKLGRGGGLHQIWWPKRLIKVQIFARTNFRGNLFLQDLIFVIMMIFAKFAKISSHEIS